jgi:hypothetical protein
MTMHRTLPLDFNLRNSNDEAVMFLDGPQDLTLALQNNMPAALFLNPLTEEHHFTLRFRAGTLRDHGGIRVADAGRKHWHVDTRDDAGVVVVGLRRKSAMTWAAHHKLHLTLEGLRGEPAGGTRATRVELTYDHIRLKDEHGALLAGKPPRHHQMVLSMASPWGAQGEPLLEAHVAGDTGNVVLNDGTEAAPIVLKLTNATAHQLQFGRTTELRMTLADGPEDRPGALATREALKACNVSAVLVPDPVMSDSVPLQVRPVEGDQAAWTLHAPENLGDDPLVDPPGHIEIRFEGLVTRHLSGPSNVHVKWMNLVYLGRHANGVAVATLQKSPLVVRGRWLGIGTSKPETALDVRGDVTISGRIRSNGRLEVDAPLQANAGLGLGGATLLAPMLCETKTTVTEARRSTAEDFEAFEGWPTSLALLDDLTFTFNFPAANMAFLAGRAAVRIRVIAASEDPPATRCEVEFASALIPAAITASGTTLIASLDRRHLGDVLTVTDIPVQDGTRALGICSAICPAPATDLTQLRDRLAAMSIIAGDWAFTFGREGPKVRWTIEATCSLSALFADIADPS